MTVDVKFQPEDNSLPSSSLYITFIKTSSPSAYIIRPLVLVLLSQTGNCAGRSVGMRGIRSRPAARFPPDPHAAQRASGGCAPTLPATKRLRIYLLRTEFVAQLAPTRKTRRIAPARPPPRRRSRHRLQVLSQQLLPAFCGRRHRVR